MLLVAHLDDGRALTRAEVLLFFFCTPALAGVEQVTLDVERSATRVADGHGLVVHEEHAAVAGEHSVLQTKRLAALARRRDLGQHSLAILGMEEPVEEAGLGEPLPSRVAEERLDLRADLECRGAFTRRIGVGHKGQVRRQRAGLRLDLA